MRKKYKKRKKSIFPEIAGDYPVKRIVVDGALSDATGSFGLIPNVEQDLRLLRATGSKATTIKRKLPNGHTITSSIVGEYVVNKVKTNAVVNKEKDEPVGFGFILYAGNDISGYYYQLLSDTFIPISGVLYSQNFEPVLESFPFCGQIEAYQRADYFFDRKVEDDYLAKTEETLHYEVPTAQKNALLYIPPYCTLRPTVDVYDVAFFGTNEFEYLLPVPGENPPRLSSTASSSWKERRFSIRRDVMNPGYPGQKGWAVAITFSSIAECCEAKSCGSGAGLSFGVARLVKNSIINTQLIDSFAVVSSDELDCLHTLHPRDTNCDILDYLTGEITDRDPVEQNELWVVPEGTTPGYRQWESYDLLCSWADMYTAFSINTPAGVMKRRKWGQRIGQGVLPGDIDTDILTIDDVEEYRSMFFDNEFQKEVFTPSLAGRSSFGDGFVVHSGNYVDFVKGFDAATSTMGNNNDSIFVESKALRLRFRQIIRPTLIVRDRMVRAGAALYDKDTPDQDSEDASNRVVFTIIDNNMRAIELFAIMFRSIMYKNGITIGSTNNFYSAISIKNSDGTHDVQSEANAKESMFRFAEAARLLQYRAGVLQKDSPEIVAGTYGINRCMLSGSAGPENHGRKLYEFLYATNKIRVDNGVGRVSFSHELSLAARMHATEAANTGLYAHIGKSGQSPLHRVAYAQYGKKSNYQYTVSENIAYGQKTAAEAINAFMLSTAGHKENLLHPQWKDVGLAVIQSSEGIVLDNSTVTNYLIWVQVFGLQQVD